MADSKKRKKSIFEYILIPLLGVMIVQGIFSFITFQYSGTTKLVHENAVKIMKQTAVNRKNLLENELVTSSDVGTQIQEIAEELDGFLLEKDCSITEFLKDSSMQEEFLVNATPLVISGLRNTKGTGAFLVLAKDEEFPAEREGVYLRDSDSEQNPDDNTDLSLLRGHAKIGSEQQIPLDPLWTGQFQFSQLTQEQTAYYNNPVALARENLDSSYKNLGYWSEPYGMDANTYLDSYRQITYSVPLIYQGTVYGVYGVELELEFLKDKLPVKEIDAEGRGSYLLVHCHDRDSIEVIAESGKLLSVSGAQGGRLKVQPTNYDGLYRIEGTDLYCMVNHLNLYNRNSPFLDDRPSLATVTTQEKLFGVGDSLSRKFLLTILVSLIFGFVCIYLVAEHTTNPIRKMADFIRKSRDSELRCFPSTNVKEMDGLYDVICNLAEQQIQTQEELREERERYLSALESTTDVIFEYNARKDTLKQYYFNKTAQIKDGGGNIEQKLYEDVLLHMEDHKELKPEDGKRLSGFFQGDMGYETVCIGVGNNESDEEYRYFEFKGKTIYDSEEKPVKIIGSVRNVTLEIKKGKADEIEKNYDRTTGLLNLNYGRQQTVQPANSGIKCQAVLIDVKNFGELNHKLGMIFGDMVLEVLGEVLSQMMKQTDIGIRCGGDQLLVLLKGQTQEEAAGFVRRLQQELEELKSRSNISLTVGTGIAAYQVGDLAFEEMLHRVCLCVKEAKKLNNGEPVIYEKLSEQKKAEPVGRKDSLRQIMSMDYDRNISLSKLFFNIFDKTLEVKDVMPFLLGKLCRRYHFRDAVISRVDFDFYTSQIVYEWHSPKGSIAQAKVIKCARKEFYELTERTEMKQCREIGDGCPAEVRRFFFLPEKGDGIYFPMMEDGCFSGAVSFVREADSAPIEKETLEGLEEIVNVIRTNLSRNRLDLASRAKSEFLSRMSHEIRTPMNAILGMCSIAMQQEEVAPKIMDCLGKINASSEYLLSLINDILDMSKIESGKLNLENKSFHLGKLMEGIENLIRPQAEQKGIHFRVAAKLEDEVIVGDSLRMNQILVNLLGNALKFTPDGGNIECMARQIAKEEDSVEIDFYVKDDGIGISDEQKQKIFYPFEQAEDSTAREFGGTGLGLSICKNLIQMMGGELRLNSSPGNGSEFSFILRFKKGEISEEIPEEKAALKKKKFDFSGKRILLVEDIAINVEIARTLLQNSHFTVEVAENGKIATEMFAASGPGYYDAILMDVRMPVMDGLEATRQIRKMDKEDALSVPIIAMSANAFDEDMRKSIESGMNGHLTKPIDVEKVFAMLDEILNGRNTGNE